MTGIDSSRIPTGRFVDSEGDLWECFDADPEDPYAKYTLIVVGKVLSRKNLEAQYGPPQEVTTR